MRRPLVALVLSVVVASALTPQATATDAPRLGRSIAALGADTATTEKFDVNGLSVILRHNSANDVVVANLYLLGGSRQLTPATAGIEALVLAASERGTKKFPGAAVRVRTARLGSTIGVEASDDWSADVPSA